MDKYQKAIIDFREAVSNHVKAMADARETQRALVAAENHLYELAIPIRKEYETLSIIPEDIMLPLKLR